MVGKSEGPNSPRLITLFDKYFELVPALSEELRNEVFRMRFQVLAVEHNYFDPDSLPNGMEFDEYDSHSKHFLLRHRPTGAWAGTVRVVLPKKTANGYLLPIQEECTDPLLADPAKFPTELVGEVSRLSISKNFRRRVTDTIISDALLDSEAKRDTKESRRIVPYMCLGLMQAVIQTCVENEKTHVAAIMEHQLLRLLGRFGIYLDEVGPLIELYGLRQPCYRRLKDLLDDAKRERLDIWEILTNDGKLRFD